MSKVGSNTSSMRYNPPDDPKPRPPAKKKDPNASLEALLAELNAISQAVAKNAKADGGGEPSRFATQASRKVSPFPDVFVGK